jgi:hypothetical protein
MNVYLQRYLGLDEDREFAKPAGFPTLRTLEKDYIGFLLEITDQNRAEVSLGGGPWALMQLVKMSKLN